jgi:hypothetical protein
MYNTESLFLATTTPTYNKEGTGYGGPRNQLKTQGISFIIIFFLKQITVTVLP